MKRSFISAIFLSFVFCVSARGQTPVRATNQLVNAQTGTTYAVRNNDAGKLITACNGSAQAYSVAQAGAASLFRAGWFVDVKNICAGTVTITPTVSTVDGAATLVLTQGQSARIVSNGTNYRTGLVGSLTAGGITNSAPSGTIPVTTDGDGNLGATAKPITWDATIRTLGFNVGSDEDVNINAIGLGAQLIIQAADGDADHVGGELTLVTGSSNGQSGGQLTLTAGNDGGGGDGGSVVIQSGKASFAGEGGDGGDIGLRAGRSEISDGRGGDILITGGRGLNGRGGNVNIQAGDSANSDQGVVSIYSPSGSSVVQVANTGLSFGSSQLSINATVTPAATTSVQTINKSAGAVNLATAESSKQVNNSTVTADSIILCTIATNDATAVIKNCVAGVGSFVITLNAAATAETRVNFWIITPQ